MNELAEDEIVQANIRAFVKTRCQERYLSFTPMTDRRRGKLVQMLNFRLSQDLDPKYAVAAPDNVHELQKALEKLAGSATGDCHILSFGRYDGQRMSLGQGLKHVCGGGTGVLLTLIPGKVGYYETEDGSICRIVCRQRMS